MLTSFTDACTGFGLALSDVSTPTLDPDSSTLSCVAASPQLSSVVDDWSVEPFDQNEDLAGLGARWSEVDFDTVPHFSIEEGRCQCPFID